MFIILVWWQWNFSLLPVSIIDLRRAIMKLLILFHCVCRTNGHRGQIVNIITYLFVGFVYFILLLIYNFGITPRWYTIHWPIILASGLNIHDAEVESDSKNCIDVVKALKQRITWRLLNFADKVYKMLVGSIVIVQRLLMFWLEGLLRTVYLVLLMNV